MTIPLIVLAILSVIGGFIGIPEIFMHGGDQLGEFLAKGNVINVPHGHVDHSTEYLLMGIATAGAIAGILIAVSMYRNYQRKEHTGFAKVLENKWYVDELYDKVIVTPLHKIGGFFKSVVENQVVDGLVNGVGKLVNYGSRQLRLLQTGQVGAYVLLMVLSMLIIFVIQFFIRK